MDNNQVIVLKNICISHTKNNNILNGVNLVVNSGELVYFTGRVGSGKTSILRLLYADIEMNDGEAIVCGFDLSKIKTKHIPKLRKRIGIIFQDFQLLPDRNVFNNLKFVLNATGWKSNQIDARINDVLIEVDMLDKIHSNPKELSGGEQQRIAIARALLNNPELIIADEPTGNLDPTSSTIIFELLHKFAKSGKAVVIATHNYSLIKKYPATIMHFQEGCVFNKSINDLPTE